MNIDLEKLLELAGKATPGNWGTDGHTGVHGESGLLADTCFAHDAAFISAANPAVVAESEENSGIDSLHRADSKQ